VISHADSPQNLIRYRIQSINQLPLSVYACLYADKPSSSTRNSFEGSTNASKTRLSYIILLALRTCYICITHAYSVRVITKLYGWYARSQRTDLGPASEAIRWDAGPRGTAAPTASLRIRTRDCRTASRFNSRGQALLSCCTGTNCVYAAAAILKTVITPCTD